MRYRLQLGILAAAVLTLVGGMFVAVQAQGRTCRDIGNIQVCGTNFETLPDGGFSFTAKPDQNETITIGPIGGQPVALLLPLDPDVIEPDLPDTAGPKDILARELAQAVFVYSEDTAATMGSPVWLQGELQLLREPEIFPLMSSALTQREDATNA